jgi:sulfur relay (sulfurtransferase) DsrF/TusC family protein
MSNHHRETTTMKHPQCNICRGGRTLRLIAGLFFVGDGVFMAVTNVPSSDIGSRLFQAFFILAGLFMIYEGAVGWCALKSLLERNKQP